MSCRVLAQSAVVHDALYDDHNHRSEGAEVGIKPQGCQDGRMDDRAQSEYFLRTGAMDANNNACLSVKLAEDMVIAHMNKFC